MSNDPTPASDETTADAADLFVTRDENDEVQPTTVTIGSYGEVEVRPMTYGASERLFGDTGQVAQVGPDVIAEILRNHVVDPDLNAYARRNDDWAENELSERIIAEEMQAFVPMSLLTEILKASGLSSVNVDMDQSGNAAIEFDSETAEGK